MNRTFLYEAALGNSRLAGLPPLTTGPLAATLADAGARFEDLIDDFLVAFDPVLGRVIGDIVEHGLHVTGVFPTEDTPPTSREWFNYTTGLSERLGFELVLATVPFEAAMPILNDAATLLTSVPAEGDLVNGLLADGYTVQLRRCTDTSRFAMTRRIYGHDPQHGVWQIVVPDADGRFPDQPGYNHVGLPQPLY